MDAGRVALIGLLASLLWGCSPLDTGHSKELHQTSFLQIPSGPNVLEIDIALIERPIGDGYLNEEMWRHVDEQIVPLEHKAHLEENGIRIGVLGGMLPSRLQNMLASPQICVEPRHLFVRADKKELLRLGPDHALCNFVVHHSGTANPLTISEASCAMEAVLHPASSGRMRIRLTPLIEHGQTRFLPRVAEDNSGFVLRAERSNQIFSSLGLEVTLSPNEYLLVGGRLDRPDTLGHCCFIRRDEPRTVQRLLVIRAHPTNFAAAVDDGSLLTDEGYVPPRAPSLAIQAAWGSDPLDIR